MHIGRCDGIQAASFMGEEGFVKTFHNSSTNECTKDREHTYAQN